MILFQHCKAFLIFVFYNEYSEMSFTSFYDISFLVYWISPLARFRYLLNKFHKHLDKKYITAISVKQQSHDVVWSMHLLCACNCVDRNTVGLLVYYLLKIQVHVAQASRLESQKMKETYKECHLCFHLFIMITLWNDVLYYIISLQHHPLIRNIYVYINSYFQTYQLLQVGLFNKLRTRKHT